MEEHELTRFPLFAALTRAERTTLGRYCDWVSVPAGRELVREGAFAYEFFLIDEGQASVRRGDDRLATLGPGDFFGEIALLGADRRTATVTAATELHLVVMHARDFSAMVAQAPEVAERVRAAMRERLEA